MSTNNISKDEFEAARLSAETFFKNNNTAFCPYLGEHIRFNRKGLDHLKFKRWGHVRPQSDQYVRYKMLRYVPEILRQSHTLQGLKKGNSFERVKIHGRWEKKMVPVEYHEFIAVMKRARVRIITKKVGAGERHFWSVVPYWKQTEFGRNLHEGDPEED